MDMNRICEDFGGKPATQMSQAERNAAVMKYQEAKNVYDAQAAAALQKEKLGLQNIGNINLPALAAALQQMQTAPGGPPAAVPVGLIPGVKQDIDYNINETTVPPTVQQLAGAAPAQFKCAGCGNVHPGTGEGPMANLCPVCVLTAAPVDPTAPATAAAPPETTAVLATPVPDEEILAAQPSVVAENAPEMPPEGPGKDDEDITPRECDICGKESACADLVASDKLSRIVCQGCINRVLITLLDEMKKTRKKKPGKKTKEKEE